MYVHGYICMSVCLPFDLWCQMTRPWSRVGKSCMARGLWSVRVCLTNSYDVIIWYSPPPSQKKFQYFLFKDANADTLSQQHLHDLQNEIEMRIFFITLHWIIRLCTRSENEICSNMAFQAFMGTSFIRLKYFYYTREWRFKRRRRRSRRMHPNQHIKCETTCQPNIWIIYYNKMGNWPIVISLEDCFYSIWT